MALTFEALRAANIDRLPQFKNKHGALAHSQRDGSDWTPAQWLQAVIGELGEYANIRKKFERGDISKEEFKVSAAKELADVQTYLDILALRCLDFGGIVDPAGIELGDATAEKFNEISKRVGATSRLNRHEMIYLASPHSHPDAAVRQARYEAAVKAAAKLFVQGKFVYSPIAHTHPIAIAGCIPPDFDHWRAYDRHILTLCDRIVVLKLEGWRESKGVQAELKMSVELNLPVEYMDA